MFEEWFDEPPDSNHLAGCDCTPDEAGGWL